MKIVITCGGTGGHIFPAIAVAEQFPKEDIIFIGGSKRLEKNLIEKQGFTFKEIAVSRKNPFMVVWGIIQSFQLIAAIRPQVVFSTGGYVTFPVVVAAWLRHIPIVLHEQNLLPGKVNRIISIIAKTVCVSFEGSRTYMCKKNSSKCIHTGNPIRKEIKEKTYDRSYANKKQYTVLVMGGSQGAQALDTIVETMKQISWKWLHLNKNNFRYDMHNVYAEADLAVCRAGATSLFELAAVGLPAILIPYPHASEDHQTLNAQYFALKNAAVVLQQKDLCENTLRSLIESLISDSRKLITMSDAMRKLSKSDAAETIAQLLRTLS